MRTASGIVVLETKNFSGAVMGCIADRDRQHTVGGEPKVIVSHRRRWRRPRHIETAAVVTRFQNPLRQNYRHVSAVKFAIGDPVVPVHGYVVSAGSAEFASELRNVVKSLDAIDEILTDRRGPSVSSVALDRAWAKFMRVVQSGAVGTEEGREGGVVMARSSSKGASMMGASRDVR